MQLLHYLKSKMFLRTIVIMVLSVVIAVFLLAKFLAFKTNHGQKIEVPDLSKLSLDVAEEKLKALDLTYLVLDSASYNPDFPAKSVIEQNPEAGGFVKEGRKIYLTLNASSYRKIPMPDVFGKTKRQVVTHLTSIGFQIGKSSYIPDRGKDVVRELKFKGKKLKKGDLIPKNSKIDMVLGDGKIGNDTDEEETEGTTTSEE